MIDWDAGPVDVEAAERSLCAGVASLRERSLRFQCSTDIAPLVCCLACVPVGCGDTDTGRQRRHGEGEGEYDPRASGGMT